MRIAVPGLQTMTPPGDALVADELPDFFIAAEFSTAPRLETCWIRTGLSGNAVDRNDVAAGVM